MESALVEGDRPRRRTAYDFARFAVAVVLLAAAGLKAHQLAASPRLPPFLGTKPFWATPPAGALVDCRSIRGLPFLLMLVSSSHQLASAQANNPLHAANSMFDTRLFR